TWIGMNDTAEEGTWVWSSGEPVGYTNWAANEPNSGASADFGFMHTNTGQWFDQNASTQYIGIVELDATGQADRMIGGPLQHYVLDISLSDPIPPAVTGVTRLPAEGLNTAELLATFSVTVSEKLDALTVDDAQFFDLR